MLDCCRRNKIKNSQISQFLIKMLFLQRYVERDIRSAHPPQKISKPSLFFIFFFINQTFLVNIYAENTANLQNRVGREFFFFFLVVCATCRSREIITKAHFPAPAAFHIIIILNKNNLFEFKHVDGPDESSMPDSIRMLSSEDSSIEQY